MNLLVTGAWSCTKAQLDTLAQMGHQVTFMQYEKDLIPVPYESVEGVICNGLFLHHPIERFVNLRYIQLTSAGFDRVPMDYIRQHEIEIHNARGVYSVPMAEFAVAGVLQLYKQSKFFAENQKQRKWEKHRGLLELHNKTVCIVGCGSVGTECAKRFDAFGCHVTGVDLYPEQNPYFETVVPLEQLDDKLSVADIVILTLPLTPKSHHLINRTCLNSLKPGVVLVNIARGAIVDTQALTEWLQARQGFAVLDVLEEEPLNPESPLWDLENVVLTPHNSFEGEGNSIRMWDILQRNLENKR